MNEYDKMVEAYKKVKSERNAQQAQLAEYKRVAADLDGELAESVRREAAQQERIAELKRQCEIGDEALTMLQENHDGDIEKLKEENERLREAMKHARYYIENPTADKTLTLKFMNEALGAGGDDA